MANNEKHLTFGQMRYRSRTHIKLSEIRPNSAERGYDNHWRKRRRQYIAEHPLCVDCQMQGRISATREPHHIIPKAKGGSDADDNLMPLCKSHHSERESRIKRLHL